MLFATVLALGSAVLHAGWNLIAKRSADPFLALWGQFLLAGCIGTVGLIAVGGVPLGALPFAIGTSVAHVPYVLALAWAYRHGDFSVAYPVARGGGALLAALGGVVLLGDELHPLSLVAILIVVAGMVLLARGARRSSVVAALIVAVSIGSYTLFDSRGVREFDTLPYIFVSAVTVAIGATITGVALGRTRDLLRLPQAVWSRTALAAAMTMTAYGMVLVAVRHAPVGYVAALRESSVLIAVVIGARMLDEGAARRRLTAAAIVLAGLVLLVISR